MATEIFSKGDFIELGELEAVDSVPGAYRFHCKGCDAPTIISPRDLAKGKYNYPCNKCGRFVSVGFDDSDIGAANFHMGDFEAAIECYMDAREELLHEGLGSSLLTLDDLDYNIFEALNEVSKSCTSEEAKRGILQRYRKLCPKGKYEMNFWFVPHLAKAKETKKEAAAAAKGPEVEAETEAAAPSDLRPSPGAEPESFPTAPRGGSSGEEEKEGSASPSEGAQDSTEPSRSSGASTDPSSSVSRSSSSYADSMHAMDAELKEQATATKEADVSQVSRPVLLEARDRVRKYVRYLRRRVNGARKLQRLQQQEGKALNEEEMEKVLKLKTWEPELDWGLDRLELIEQRLAEMKEEGEGVEDESNSSP